MGESVLRWGVAVVVLALPSVARAGDGVTPRTPVVWTDVPCVELVDRSVDPVFEFHYDIPAEDTDLTKDEVADSRTHQFLAFCRDHNPQDALPNWIAWADVDAAAMVVPGFAPSLVTDDDVLDTSTEWADCGLRITADADRRPITFAEAAMPVHWDTTGLAVGPWIIDGYTYQPVFNVHARRPGIVMVVDDPAPEASPPGLAITTLAKNLYRDEAYTMDACVAAMDGSTVTGYWSLTDSIEWVPFVEDEPVMGESVSISFTPPEELVGDNGMLRLDVTDPMGRSYSGYQRDVFFVVDQDSPGSPPEGGSSGSGTSGGSDGGTAAAGSTSTGTSAATGGSTTGDAEETASDGGGGCACRAGPDRRGFPVLLGLLTLALRRRSRQFGGPSRVRL